MIRLDSAVRIIFVGKATPPSSLQDSWGNDFALQWVLPMLLRAVRYSPEGPSAQLFMHACIYLYVYIHIYIHICMCIYTYIDMTSMCGGVCV